MQESLSKYFQKTNSRQKTGARNQKKRKNWGNGGYLHTILTPPAPRLLIRISLTFSFRDIHANSQSALHPLLASHLRETGQQTGEGEYLLVAAEVVFDSGYGNAEVAQGAAHLFGEVVISGGVGFREAVFDISIREEKSLDGDFSCEDKFGL